MQTPRKTHARGRRKHWRLARHPCKVAAGRGPRWRRDMRGGWGRALTGAAKLHAHHLHPIWARHSSVAKRRPGRRPPGTPHAHNPGGGLWRPRPQPSPLLRPPGPAASTAAHKKKNTFFHKALRLPATGVTSQRVSAIAFCKCGRADSADKTRARARLRAYLPRSMVDVERHLALACAAFSTRHCADLRQASRRSASAQSRSANAGKQTAQTKRGREQHCALTCPTRRTASRPSHPAFSTRHIAQSVWPARGHVRTCIVRHSLKKKMHSSR